jgi:hypothetical protein
MANCLTIKLHVSVGSKATFWPWANHFRSTPDQRTSSDQPDWSVWCHFRTHAPQQRESHSTTSAARASRVNGTVRPSALAVLTLMANS